MLEWIYWSISWILLLWHSVWAVILPGAGHFLATDWEWILAIVFLVITVRVILFPVFVKQIRSQRAMQALQPKMKALQEKHKGDRETLQKEVMELYRSEKVNPLMGCLPMFLQIPVFLGLFHVLKRLNPANAGKTLYGWTENEFISASAARLFNAPITAKFSSTPLQLAELHANGTNVKIVAGVLVIIMMITTYMTSRQMILKTGWSEDPQQRMIQKLMLYGIPVSLLISGWAFPIGVIIYWVTTNLFSYCQQYWVLHKYPPPVMAGSSTAIAGAGVGTGRTATAIAPSTRSTTGRTGSAKPEAKGFFARAMESARTAAEGRAGKSGSSRTGTTGTASRPAPRTSAAKSTPAGSTGDKNGARTSSAGVPRKLVSFGKAKTTDASSNGAQPVVDGRALAPKPGAKPANRKKGGAKRRSG